MSDPAGVYKVLFTSDGEADYKGLDGSIKERFKSILTKKLQVNPEGYGSPLRAPLVNYHKHEFASHRVIYYIIEEDKTVVVCSVGSRKQGDAEDIYKDLETASQVGKMADQVKSVLKGIIKPKDR